MDYKTTQFIVASRVNQINAKHFIQIVDMALGGIEIMAHTKCSFCGYNYDEWYGDTRNGVPSGVTLAQLAGSVCSRCGLQGTRHQRQPNPMYAGLEAEYYDQFAGKAGIAFYCKWLREETEVTEVLEVGAGTGRISLELAQTGISVTGLDLSTEMLEWAEKKKKRMDAQKKRTHLDFVEGDIFHWTSEKKYSHIILPDGLFQHYTLSREHRELLRKIKSLLAMGGQVAIDIVIPPTESTWSYKRKKRITEKKEVYQVVEGETSLNRQLFRYRLTYETFENHIERPRYRVEREMALILPREISELMQAEGFHIIAMVANYRITNEIPWAENEMIGHVSPHRALDPTASLVDIEDWTAVEGIVAYEHLVWQNGGYPIAEVMPGRSPSSPMKWTIIARLL
jgi:ubiquinone/menaquinone biosynthesis C-methylase UbiE/rubredoxin